MFPIGGTDARDRQQRLRVIAVIDLYQSHALVQKTPCGRSGEREPTGNNASIPLMWSDFSVNAQIQSGMLDPSRCKINVYKIKYQNMT
jgi:hypothetical protein